MHWYLPTVTDQIAKWQQNLITGDGPRKTARPVGGHTVNPGLSAAILKLYSLAENRYADIKLPQQKSVFWAPIPWYPRPNTECDYFMNMLTYHISDATGPQDDIRSRRYFPLKNKQLKGTELSGSFFNTGLFWDQQWMHIAIIKQDKYLWTEIRPPKMRRSFTLKTKINRRLNTNESTCS